MACAIADRLLASLRESRRLGRRGRVVGITSHASAGVAVVAAGACEAGEILRRAVVALYRAKGAGEDPWSLFDGSAFSQPPGFAASRRGPRQGG